jgi:hypothetical protein
LKIYRIAREYSYHVQGELVSLGKTLHDQYGGGLLLYDHLSSNAYSEVIEKGKFGWFGRSSMFNTSDPGDNRAEFVLIDPQTRAFLEPTSMPDSGEIKPSPAQIPSQCNRSLPVQ